MKHESIDYWLFHIRTNKDFSSEIYNEFHSEFPLFVSWVGERTCNLQCAHCIFQKENQWRSPCDTTILTNLVATIQKRQQAIVIHEGRILRRWHIPVLRELQQLGAKVGLIDNGTYVKYIPLFERPLDWLDISIDGTERVHNKQRCSSSAYQTAREGIDQAGRIAKKVTALYTLTQENYHDILLACEAVVDVIDEFHITTLSPARYEIRHLEITPEQLGVAWKQIELLQTRYPKKIFVRMYHEGDLMKLKQSSPREFSETMWSPIALGQGRVVLRHKGVTFSYLPKSLSINETIVCDVDMWYRLPYSIAYTIKELSDGKDRFGNDISKYSIRQLTEDTDIFSVYKKAVHEWWNYFGKQSLEKEKQLLFS